VVVPAALRQAGAQVVVHDDVFPQATRDEVWLVEAGRQGWIVLTKDRNLRYNSLEITAMRNSRVRVFLLVSAGLRGVQMGSTFVLALRKMSRLSVNNEPPFIAKVYRDSAVSLWIDHAGQIHSR
jgi:PIN domain-containing protein